MLTKAMNLSDLKNLDLKDIDLKNIDFQNLIEELKARQHLIIRGILILGAILGGYFAYSNRQAETLKLQKEIPLLEEKTKVIEDYKKSETKKKNFLEDFPSDLEEDELKDFVTDLAAKYHMSIKSFSSIETSSDTYFDQLHLQLNFTAVDFIELVLFIHEIEASGYTLRIDSWHGQMQQQTSQPMPGSAETNTSIFDSQIKITALKIKKWRN